VSLGIRNTNEEVDTLIRVLDNIARKASKSAGKQADSGQNNSPVLPKAEVKKQMKNFVKAASNVVYSRH
jgi:hypothetical protein